ncbi:ubiquinol-cytochrome-c reductase complex assembly factor 1 [Colletes gigas]|uniref:ubiquinol-cytochrome-c reductase complex assembly factor 1 n=1 Tax=Colletes gigas TaxID=935657 RepID=UPI001C9B1DB0|nr:ubiquinol-cytochrome-c reductase complex assembly factor 1 [Colletes gigas]
MYCTRMLSLKKTLSLTMKSMIERQYIITNGIDFSVRPRSRQFSNSSRIKGVQTNIVRSGIETGFINKLLYKLGINKQKYQLMGLGYFMYEDLVDTLNYTPFFEDFNMPDTFFSWYLVTELHIWMLMVRFMSEGEAGKIVRYNLVEAMWRDIDIRVNKLGTIHPKIKRQQICSIAAQFNGAMICYDEGILSDDKALAGALWARFFGLECNNPEQLEKLLIYTRKQTHLLDKIPSSEIFACSKLDWIDLRDVK